MGIRRYKPTSPGRRGASVSDFAELTPGAAGASRAERAEEAFRRSQQSGRHYRPTSWRRSQAALSADRLPSQQRRRAGESGTRFSTIRIAVPASRCCIYADGEKRFILAPDGLQVGQEIMSGPDAPPTVGNSLPMRNIPLAMAIHNVELQPGAGVGCVVRPVPAQRWLPVKPIGRKSRCLAVKFGACLRRVGPRLARLAMPIT